MPMTWQQLVAQVGVEQRRPRRAGHQRVGAAQVLLAAADRGQRPQLAGRSSSSLNVARGREHLESGVDHGVVEALARRPASISCASMCPRLPVQTVQLGEHLGDAVAQGVAGRVLRVPAAAARRKSAAARSVASPLIGQLSRGLRPASDRYSTENWRSACSVATSTSPGLLTLSSNVCARQQIERGPGGQRGREDPQREECHQRHGDQRDDLRTDRPVAGSHQAPPEGRSAVRDPPVPAVRR